MLTPTMASITLVYFVHLQREREHLFKSKSYKAILYIVQTCTVYIHYTDVCTLVYATFTQTVLLEGVNTEMYPSTLVLPPGEPQSFVLACIPKEPGLLSILGTK